MSRIADVERKTSETDVTIGLNIDGEGKAQVGSGNGFFDHMLNSLSRHGLLNLTLKCLGDIEIDFHHSAEDIGITLGQAFDKALGDRRGITRFAHAYVPMDEALIRVVIDLGGRSSLVYNEELRDRVINTFEVDLVYDFLKGFADNAKCNIHVDILRARNSHHAIEAIFKALGRALRIACSIDERAVNVIPSTKGSL